MSTEDCGFDKNGVILEESGWGLGDTENGLGESCEFLFWMTQASKILMTSEWKSASMVNSYQYWKNLSVTW